MNTIIKSKIFKSGVLSLITLLLFAVITPNLASAKSVEVERDSNLVEVSLLNPETGEEEIIIQPNGIVTVGVIIGIVVGAIAIGKSVYGAGKYAGEVAHKKHGLTPKVYKAFRNYFRVPLTIFNPLVAQGFDDYFYGLWFDFKFLQRS